MSEFSVLFLDDQGALVVHYIRAWHAAAAERICRHLYGGSLHTVNSPSQGEH